MNAIDSLVIKAKLHRSKDSSSNLINLEWSVENISNKSATITGYRLHFTKQNNDREIVIRKHQKFQTNPHVVTTLWEGEKRFYIWKQVHPKYYGVIKPGKWYYLVQIAYLLEGRKESQKTDWIASNKMDFDKLMLSDILEQEIFNESRMKIPNYLQNKFNLESKLKCIANPRISRGHIPDQMCYTKDGWVAVIEYKKTASLDSLMVVNFYLNKITPKYARNPEYAVGIVVAQHFDEPFLAKIKNFPRIHYIHISDLNQ